MAVMHKRKLGAMHRTTEGKGYYDRNLTTLLSGKVWPIKQRQGMTNIKQAAVLMSYNTILLRRVNTCIYRENTRSRHKKSQQLNVSEPAIRIGGCHTHVRYAGEPPKVCTRHIPSNFYWFSMVGHGWDKGTGRYICEMAGWFATIL